jgi:pimeloyl-ACP methyl ester carboxylesterase
VARLALITAAGFGDVPQRAYWLQVVPDALAPLAHPFAGRTTARLILRDVYGPDSSWSTRDEEELLAPYAQPGIFRAMLRTLKEFDWSLHPPEALARLPRGTLLLFGTHDKVVQPVALEQAAAAMTDGRLVTLPRVGHLPHVEAAGQVAALLRDFLEPARMAMPPGAG